MCFFYNSLSFSLCNKFFLQFIFFSLAMTSFFLEFLFLIIYWRHLRFLSFPYYIMSTFYNSLSFSLYHNVFLKSVFSSLTISWSLFTIHFPYHIMMSFLQFLFFFLIISCRHFTIPFPCHGVFLQYHFFFRIIS